MESSCGGPALGRRVAENPAVDRDVYGFAMGNVTQIAFQIDNESLLRVDALAAARSSSRAEVLRTAVEKLLSAEREAEIDARLAAGYDIRPPSDEEDGWADASLDGLEVSDLDW